MFLSHPNNLSFINYKYFFIKNNITQIKYDYHKHAVEFI